MHQMHRKQATSPVKPAGHAHAAALLCECADCCAVVISPPWHQQECKGTKALWTASQTIEVNRCNPSRELSSNGGSGMWSYTAICRSGRSNARLAVNSAEGARHSLP